MTEINEILPEIGLEQKAFILDHGKTEDGQLKYADDLTSYGWNIKRYNRLKEGAYVLNRRSGKLTKDRKFEIYAGGYVNKISKPDEDGNVTALISNAFIIEPPIRQGDSLIENFQWETKSKKSGTWAYFWNQYGMNEISINEYIRLISPIKCIPENHRAQDSLELRIRDIEKIQQEHFDGFNIELSEGKKAPINKKERSFTARKVDFDKIKKSKDIIGSLGEEIVMDLLISEATASGARLPVHVSNTEGDGLGYDIRAWGEQGQEIHIEVKATTKKYADGFDITPNEIEASKNSNFEYMIYRVFDLNLSLHTSKLKIYYGEVSEETFKLLPTGFKAYTK